MLNIKDPEVHRLAKELAELEHTSMTQAVLRALRLALDDHDRQRERRRQVLEQTVNQARAAGLNDGAEQFDALYDPATGLPR